MTLYDGLILPLVIIALILVVACVLGGMSELQRRIERLERGRS